MTKEGIIHTFGSEEAYGAVKNASASVAAVFLGSYRPDHSEDVAGWVFLADKLEGSA